MRYMNHQNSVAIQFHCKSHETFSLNPLSIIIDECPYIEDRISLQVSWNILGIGHDL